MKKTPANLPSVVVIGAGFAGLEAVRALAQALASRAPGETVDVEFARDMETLKRTLRLGER